MTTAAKPGTLVLLLVIAFAGCSGISASTQPPGVVAACALFIFVAGVFVGRSFARAQHRRESRRLVVERKRLQTELDGLRLEQERERIARELHDGVGAELHALIWVARSLDPSADTTALIERIERSLEELRGAVRVLRDVDTEWLALVNDVRRRMGSVFGDIAVRVVNESPDAAQRVPAEFAHQMLRTIQEAVTNAIRHAKPRQVVVTLRADGDFSATVSDDGTGFDLQAVSRRSGLANLTLRARAWGGALSIDSDHTGTRVTVSFPKQRVRSLREITTILR